MAETERIPGKTYLMGLEMQQHRDAPHHLHTFFEMAIRTRGIARILEIGTAAGGLAVLLSIYCRTNQIEFRTIDIVEPKHLGLLEALNAGDVEIGSIFEADTMADWIKLIKCDGRTVLLCDGGNKKQEMRLLVPHLKVGDIAMAHDYAPSSTKPAKFWNHREIMDSHLEGLPIEPYYGKTPNDLRSVGWGCWRRVAE